MHHYRRNAVSNESVDEEFPHFSMVQLHFREPVKGAPVPEFLNVPDEAIGAVYQSLDFLESVTIEPYGELVKFGTTRLFGSILWDPHTGHVVQSGKQMDHVVMVNTTLERFSLCVRGLIERYPFDADEGGDSWDVAAQDVEDFLRHTDPEAYVIDGNLWYEVKWDIANGDFS
ncbi:SUKH-4 family immunity protein [Streptomyces sp. NBC_00841]|uniref:SUKH-4 family immunity protein n=1 Tax=Streptomyces sp. NBC_00841 TaxID=2975847 RepID=UPI002DDBB4D4|nr:SUKH-4 family immunity protein [Streptomyces sp. NBC_00841]